MNWQTIVNELHTIWRIGWPINIIILLVKKVQVFKYFVNMNLTISILVNSFLNSFTTITNN